MERKYDIKLDYLQYLKIIIKENGLFDYNDDLVVIDKLSNILNGLFSEDINKEISLGNKLNENWQDLVYYKQFYPFIRQIIKNSILDGENKIEYRQTKISDEEAVNLIEEFFRKQNSSYQQRIDDFLEDANEHIKFIPPTSHTDGLTFFIRATGDYFCIVPNYPNISKVAILAHETTHVLDWFNNEDFLGQFLISETHSLLMEMLACDFYQEKFKIDEEGQKRKRELHNLIKADSLTIYELMQIIYIYKKEGEKGLNKIRRIYSSKYLKYITGYSLDDFFKYQIAYLIAIELYTLYQYDKEKALWTIDKIVSMETNETVIDSLERDNIVLGEHFSEYERKLLLKRKKTGLS